MRAVLGVGWPDNGCTRRLNAQRCSAVCRAGHAGVCVVVHQLHHHRSAVRVKRELRARRVPFARAMEGLVYARTHADRPTHTHIHTHTSAAAGSAYDFGQLQRHNLVKKYQVPLAYRLAGASPVGVQCLWSVAEATTTPPARNATVVVLLCLALRISSTRKAPPPPPTKKISWRQQCTNSDRPHRNNIHRVSQSKAQHAHEHADTAHAR